MRATSSRREGPDGKYDPKAPFKHDLDERSNSDNFQVAPGKTHVLMDVKGPGVITHMWITFLVATEHLRAVNGFDESLHMGEDIDVLVRMRLAELMQNRITLAFEYWRRQAAGEELVARGEQQVACMKREGPRLLPTAVPASLREALAAYAE